MNRRLIGAAGVALALLGCNDDATRASVVDDSASPTALPRSSRQAADAAVPPLLAARDDKAGDSKDAKAPTTAKEALKQGLEAAQKNDLVSAIGSFELATKLDPKDRQAFFFLTLARQLRAGQMKEGPEQTAMFLSSAESARKLLAVATDPTPNEKGIAAQALYKEACAHAKGKALDKAMASLTEAVDVGFADDKTMAQDDDLAALRSRPEFPKLVARVKESSAKMAEMAAKMMKERDQETARQMLPEVKKELGAFKSFPFTFEYPGLDGKPVKLDDYKGKVTIVDIWGTWCPPCRMEIPHFIALKNNYKDKGVEIVGINRERTQKGKEKDLIEPFVKETGINYTLVIGDDKVEESVPDFSGYPTTLFLDREGKVRYKHVGYAPYEVIEFVVKTLLDEKGGKPATP